MNSIKDEKNFEFAKHLDRYFVHHSIENKDRRVTLGHSHINKHAHKSGIRHIRNSMMITYCTCFGFLFMLCQ